MKREPARLPVADAQVEKAIDEVRRSVVELCRDAFLSGVDIEVTLLDTVPFEVKHGLGRRFVGYSQSAPRGAVTAGLLVESARASDRSSFTLLASGFGAPITLSLRVW
jgi:hypothetical protein